MLKIEFITDNDAFTNREASESAQMLEAIAARLREGLLDGPVVDRMGNKIGTYSLDDN